ncbi:MAG: hypothetical protein ABSC48_16135 [Terracidiphilus sp.]
MKPTEQTKKYVISKYVNPARLKGEKTIQVRVGSVQKELGWTNRTPSVFSTLLSKDFQREAGVELIERRDGPPSGGPSTTWQLVFRVLDKAEKPPSIAEVVQGRTGLRALYGLCAETFRALGGGEEFLRQEREWGPDVWERYETESANLRNAETAK